jgi:hypothetical protein
MSCCHPTNGRPGTPNFSSGLTSQRASAAARADQASLLARLRGGVGNCGPVRPNPKSAIYSSILTQQQATACQPTPDELATFPKVGTTESIRIQRTAEANLRCATSPLNPNTRYPLLPRYVPNPVCPPTPTEQLNSTLPKPTFYPGCNPTPFIR